MGIGEQTGLRIALVDLNDITVTTSNQHVFTVRSNIEITWMNTRKLITYFSKKATCINLENSHTVGLQAIAGIQEFSVRTQMYIRTAMCLNRIGCNRLFFFQNAIAVVKCNDCTGQFIHQISLLSIWREGEMTTTRTSCNLKRRRSANLENIFSII